MVSALQTGEEISRRSSGPYRNIDIDDEPEAIERLRALQGGAQIVPMVEFSDGTHAVNPSDEALAGRFGLTRRGM